MKRNIAALLGVVFLLLSACGGGGSENSNDATSNNATSDIAAFRLINKSSSAVTGVWVSKSSEKMWGPNLLGNRTVRQGKVFYLKLSKCNIEYDISISFSYPPFPQDTNGVTLSNKPIPCGMIYELTIEDV